MNLNNPIDLVSAKLLGVGVEVSLDRIGDPAQYWLNVELALVLWRWDWRKRVKG